MCKFSYYHYDGCRHKEVRLDSYCARSLFNAGIDGILTTKCEQKLDGLNTQSQSVLVWDGLTGYCTGCRRLYGIGEQLHLASTSYVDSSATNDPQPLEDDPYIYIPRLKTTVIDLLGLRSQATDLAESVELVSTFPSVTSTMDRNSTPMIFPELCTKYVRPLPSFTHTTPISLHNIEGLSSPSTSTHPSASPSASSSSHFQTNPGTSHTSLWTRTGVWELEFNEYHFFTSEGPRGGGIKYKTYRCIELEKKAKRGKLSEFTQTNGMTKKDLRALKGAVESGRIGEMFRSEFEPRGMPWEMFWAQIQIVQEALKQLALLERPNR